MIRVTQVSGPDPEARFHSWAMASLAKSIAYAEQARVVSEHRALVAISGYYALLHGGIALALSIPSSLEARIAQSVNAASSTGKDPAERLRNYQVGPILQELSKVGGLPVEVSRRLAAAEKLRKFLNYGPRLLSHGPNKSLHFNTCEFPQHEVDDLAEYLLRYHEQVVAWLAGRDAADRHRPHVMCFEMEPYFAASDGFLKGIFADAVLAACRSRLEALERLEPS